MLIVFPFIAEKLADVERNLTGQLIRSEMKKMSASSGYGPDIFLPRSKIEYETDIKELLQGLGVVSVFDGQLANLSGMISTEDDVAVSKIIHKAVVELNEEGTEAAAATGIGARFCCSRLEFRMNRPFLFIIMNRQTKTPVFVGRMSRPSPATVKSQGNEDEG